ncbi:fimbrial protein [Stenotrophomonas maltophilia]
MPIISSRGRKALAALALLGSAVTTQQASAECRIFDQTVTDNPRIAIGRIVVPPNARIGDVVSRTASTSFEPKDRVGTCLPSGGMIYGDYSSVRQRIPVPGLSNVYQTEVEGIGVRIYFDNGSSLPLSLVVNPSYLAVPNNRWIVELVKTGEVVGSGIALPAGPVASVYTDGSGPSRPYLTASLAGSVVVVSPTCEVQAGSRNIAVDLGSVSQNVFSGIGSRSADHDFDIKLNCTGGREASYQGDVSIRIDAQSGSSNVNGVMSITESSSSARHIGIQLVQRDGTEEREIRFGRPISLGTTSPGAQVLTLSLRARYVQTEAGPVGAGSANGQATFTVQYD